MEEFKQHSKSVMKPTMTGLILVMVLQSATTVFSQKARDAGSVLKGANEQIPDTIHLRPGWNWISFPRLDREDDDPVPSIPTVENRIFPQEYEYAEVRNLLPTAPPDPGEEDEIRLIYENFTWTTDLLNEIQSTEGYKIWIDPKDIEHHLLLRGNMLQPTTSRTLYAGKDNWTGYFLPETQNPLHAIGNNLNKLKSIKANEWFAANMGTEAKPIWISTPLKPLKYGDMLVLTPFGDIEDFQWERLGNPFEDVLLQQPENYSYTELSGYTAMIIEYDTTEIPLEIGAFVGDSCVGACVVDPSDSLAYIRAYIPTMSNDSVTFECYYGLKSGRGTRINQYALMDENNRMLSNRPILTRNKKSFYYVSLRNAGQQLDSEAVMTEVGANMKVYPNPSRLDFSIEYEISHDGQLTIELLSLQGSQLATIRSGWHSQGVYRFDTSWQGLLNGDGRSGMYLVRLTTNKTSIVQRVFKF
ncbi:MAG: T9SS type A sorting domain-containing protein [Bacteroidales bacterium]|nr:T9SS type A sorting domain-containing protein [Bacteroidales bacterium]